VVLEGENIGGYRKDRSDVFSHFNFKGRTVLDCGCNIGELSRLARVCGARLVDGVEYDRYFVQVARLLNAYFGTSRVSFEEGDLTEEDTIGDVYDVTLAFSVFPYILPILSKISSATTEALVLETHNITSDQQKNLCRTIERVLSTLHLRRLHGPRKWLGKKGRICIFEET